MEIMINGNPIVKTPSEFKVSIADLDDGATTTRTADGTLHRDRIAVKRKLEMSWNALTGTELSNLLSSVKDEFFIVSYPDPQTGVSETKTFYVGDRSVAVAVEKNGILYWDGLSMNFIEQ